LNGTYAEAHALLGFLYSMIRQHDKALAQGEKAVALNPNSAECHFRLGKILTFAGRWEESIPEYEKAMRLNPIPPNMYIYSIGLAYGFTGKYDEADEVLRIQPRFTIDKFKKKLTYKREVDRKKLLGALRKAGLPG
jgi:tetratricopeptide (TPR) repeat protein